MRQIKFAMVLMLSVFVCAHMHAQESVDHEGISRGRFTVSVTERSRLSDVKVFMRRFGWPMKAVLKFDRRGGQYGISGQSFEVYVPNDYQPSIPYGLFVWIDASDESRIPEGVKPILDKYRLIWVGANNAGNTRFVGYRYGLAIDAAYNMKKLYTIDEERVYIGGISGGGGCASEVAVAYPELFYGGFYVVGCNYFRKISRPDKPGSY